MRKKPTEMFIVLESDYGDTNGKWTLVTEESSLIRFAGVKSTIYKIKEVEVLKHKLTLEPVAP